MVQRWLSRADATVGQVFDFICALPYGSQGSEGGLACVNCFGLPSAHSTLLSRLYAELAVFCSHLQEGLSLAGRTYPTPEPQAPASQQLWQT
jgi:hypothetical protein